MSARSFAILCPRCGETCDAHTNISDPTATPSVDDCGVCIYCACLYMFELGPHGHLTPREFTNADFVKVGPAKALELGMLVGTVKKFIESQPEGQPTDGKAKNPT